MTKRFSRAEQLFDPRVAVFDAGYSVYPGRPPFHPPERFPEYPFANDEVDQDNYVYDAVRQLFVLLGLDMQHYGSAEWNPLGDIIRPGDNIVLKPNLVISDHPAGLPGLQASVVHGSVLRAFLDYAFIANGGQGSITVADSPIKEVDFERILELTGMGPTVHYLNEHYGLDIKLVDFRDLQVTRNRDRVMVDSQHLPGDPMGYRVIDLGQQSMLAEIAQHASQYRSTAAVYENAILQAHNEDKNLYSLPERILQADVLISLAKLKTHRKAGVTLSLKNLVGLTNEKRWLPHHRIGSPSKGGDLYADDTRADVKLKESIKDILITHSWGRWGAQYVGIPLHKLYQRTAKPLLDGMHDAVQIEDGDWYGNDTVWRMVLDLNTLFFYADAEGILRSTPQRRYLSVIDGIIGGMGEGPLKPRPREAGILVAGFNPVAVDMVCTRLMGFNSHCIPSIRRAKERDWLPLTQSNPEDIQVASNLERWQEILQSEDAGLGFIPSSGWQGHIELDRQP
jgi:uncharacterized protein (DUF362 family)